MAQQAHLEARQRIDIQRDLSTRIAPSDGPFHVGQSIWYYHRDPSKIRGGIWLPGKIIAMGKPPMIQVLVEELSTAIAV